MRIFISHASADTWIARQMARCTQECEVEVMIDAWDLKSGDEVVPALAEMLARSDELAVLFTPSSRVRAWVWMEIGFMRLNRKRVVPIFHGMTARNLSDTGEEGAIIGLMTRQLNDFDQYLDELRRRVVDAR